MIYQPIQEMIQTSILPYLDSIPEERKVILREIQDYIAKKQKTVSQVRMNFICTHNSRRSHISQILAYTAVTYFGKKGFSFYSGGTEATAFNPRAVEAFRSFGYSIAEIQMPQLGLGLDNPVYAVRVDNETEPLIAFSKKYDHPFNATGEYLAVMTCDHASENCPVVFGSDHKTNLNFTDPKASDGTPQEKETYRNKILEIGREIFWIFC